MDGKETAKRKQVLEGNAFYEIDLECMRKKEKREEMEKREREARKPKRFRRKRILVKKSPGAVDPHPGLFLPEHLGRLKKGQQPHPQLLLLPHPQPLLFHPPQQNRRIRTSQQSELQPLLLFPHPHPPQQERRSRIQIILQPLFPNRLLLETPHPLSQPQPLSHPHPQFVAAKSLMFVPPKESFCLQFMI